MRLWQMGQGGPDLPCGGGWIPQSISSMDPHVSSLDLKDHSGNPNCACLVWSLIDITKEDRYCGFRRFINSGGEVTVRRKTQGSSEIREALRALLSDIEGMYQGAQASAERAQHEEFFGPFSVGKLGDAEIEADISVSWPNLPISMRNAKNALRNSDAEDAS